MKTLEKKAILITGASRGIGKAIALKCFEEKANLILSSQSDACIKLANEIKEMGGHAKAIICDFKNVKDIQSLIQNAYKVYDRLDVLVNSVGITQDKVSLLINEKSWDEVLEVNLKGCFFASQQALKYMMKQNAGKIINISSIVALTGNLGQSHYSASKAAIIAMSKSIAKEMASRNIQVNSVLPGFIQTDMLNKIHPDQLEKYKESIPLKRFGKPEEVAELVAFLASHSSDYITGQSFIIDGGLTMY